MVGRAQGKRHPTQKSINYMAPYFHQLRDDFGQPVRARRVRANVLAMVYARCLRAAYDLDLLYAWDLLGYDPRNEAVSA